MEVFYPFHYGTILERDIFPTPLKEQNPGMPKKNQAIEAWLFGPEPWLFDRIHVGDRNRHAPARLGQPSALGGTKSAASEPATVPGGASGALVGEVFRIARKTNLRRSPVQRAHLGLQPSSQS